MNITKNMIISPSVSLLAAGVVSGICFLLFGKLRSKKHTKTKDTKKIRDEEQCACCLASFTTERGVCCSDCGFTTCEKTCSRWSRSDNSWHCLFCYKLRLWKKRNEKWFENFGGVADEEEKYHFFRTAKLQLHTPEHADAISSMEKIEENREKMRIIQAVRILLEKIVEDLVGNVDDTPINRLYENFEYDKFLEEYRPRLIAALIQLTTFLEASHTDLSSTDPSRMAHNALKETIERAVEEARKLPGLGVPADFEHVQERRTIADNNYEDLLANAILNKVIEKFQREHVDGNSNVLHDTEPPKVKYPSTESKYGLQKEDGRSYKSCYYLGDSSDHTASTIHDKDRREPISFTMEERIEEVTTFTSDDELRDNDILEYEYTGRVPFPEFGMDIIDPPRELSSPSPSTDSSETEHSRIRTKHITKHTIDLVSPIESWEDNWLFQKKRTSRPQPDPVVMLVPSSNAYYKALIGDKDAEDTSDLSECSSTRSDEEIEKELIETINNVVPRTSESSECTAENNQEIPKNAVKDEVNVFKMKTIIVEDRTVTDVCERVNDMDNKKPSENSIEEMNKDGNNKVKQDDNSLSFVSAKVEENRNEENGKDTTECSERTIVSTVKIFVEEVPMQPEKSSIRNNDRGNDEGEEQLESEYTEHYDTAIQRHLDSLTKVYSVESNTVNDTRQIAENEPKKLENSIDEPKKSEYSEVRIQLSCAMNENCINVTAENNQLSTPPRPGTIAEREHKKWENAPPIENNPYSEESIRKRSWERRYSRKSADIPRAHCDLMKDNEANLEALLTPNCPDIKRFGRDYYINQSKTACGEQTESTRSAMPSSSRSNSSLSQRSNSANDEQRERQKESTSKEINAILIVQENKDTRTSPLQKNNDDVVNPETNNHHRKIERKGIPNEQRKDQRTDDIFENQRKNSKNEINAKLNNQEHNHEIEHESEKESKKIRKIDLKAYGFENEFPDQKSIESSSRRMINKLDLRSFGYQEGLRCAGSNNRLDQQSNDEKSNLTKCMLDRDVDHHEYKSLLIDTSLDCKNAEFAKDLNKLCDEIKGTSSLSSNKPMPNVTDDTFYHADPVEVNNEDDDELAARALLHRMVGKSGDTSLDVITDDGLLNDNEEYLSDVERSFEDIYIRSKDQYQEINETPMPSVKRLAEVFGKRQVAETMPVKTTNIGDVKKRSFTPEVQLVETPRQMHSLTARSLSKEFREGLRQTSNKVILPSVNQEANRTETIRSKRINDDRGVISPGKLKSNIIFWEQMQTKN